MKVGPGTRSPAITRQPCTAPYHRMASIGRRCPIRCCPRNSDTGNTAYYDPGLQKYVGFFRMWFYGRRAIGRGKRTIFRAGRSPNRCYGPARATPPTSIYIPTLTASTPAHRSASTLSCLVPGVLRDTTEAYWPARMKAACGRWFPSNRSSPPAPTADGMAAAFLSAKGWSHMAPTGWPRLMSATQYRTRTRAVSVG